MAPALNSSENAVQLAVVGAGLVGRRHIDVIRRTKSVKLSAIVDNSPAADAFADSIEQFSVHVDFQLPYAFADRRLGQVEFFCGDRKGAGFSDFYEGF